MKKIKFINDSKPYNVMVEDERFMVCSRVYTIQESIEEAKEWDKNLESKLKEHWEDLDLSEKEKWNDDFEYWSGESDEAFNKEQQIKYLELGERPTEYKEDTQCYTIVDKKEKVRSSDNYYNKFNYLDKKECEQALEELNNGELEISRRNKIELDIEKILEE
ncbi:hypothetical protein [Aliarcobacter butzleri]|uniref:hypothetical protein n=1 Tax=Aliarcobacter butzleri TaxID=28197 RepID=UPI0021B4DC34|nr:hypothetical protein [Aliarcobacter butzleri]MCT7643881.1 hypothetical protein [Aliarcobacter butzleri]